MRPQKSNSGKSLFKDRKFKIEQKASFLWYNI